MQDPNGGIQPPIHLWWDLPSDDVGPWWVLPGTGAPAYLQTSERFAPAVAVQGSARFHLEQRFVQSDGLRVGDTVFWLVPDEGNLASVSLRYPQRVVEAREFNSGQEIWTLVDSLLDTEHISNDPDLLSILTQRSMLLRRPQRAILEIFYLNVICPFCAAPGQQVQMGMPSGPPPHWVDAGGCIVQPGQPLDSYRCIRCSAEWFVEVDGRLVVTHVEEDCSLPVWAHREPQPPPSTSDSSPES